MFRLLTLSISILYSLILITNDCGLAEQNPNNQQLLENSYLDRSSLLCFIEKLDGIHLYLGQICENDKILETSKQSSEEINDKCLQALESSNVNPEYINLACHRRHWRHCFNYFSVSTYFVEMKYKCL